MMMRVVPEWNGGAHGQCSVTLSSVCISSLTHRAPLELACIPSRHYTNGSSLLTVLSSALVPGLSGTIHSSFSTTRLDGAGL